VELFALLRKVLHPDPKHRCTVAQIQADPWFCRETVITHQLNSEGMMEQVLPILSAKQCSGELSQPLLDQPSRPAKRHKSSVGAGTPGTERATPQSQLSQFVGTQADDGPTAARETRFTSRLPLEDTVTSITTAFLRLGIKEDEWFIKPENLTIIVTTTDSRHAELDFAARLYPRLDAAKITVDFRLTRGDGLEFKRKFADMCEIIFQIDNINAATEAP
jgi:hypothetical protein